MPAQSRRSDERLSADCLALRELRQLLRASGRFSVVDITPIASEGQASNLQACGGCDIQLARRIGAELAITGTVQKVSKAYWPLAAHAQQRERVRRIGVLMNLAADDPEASARVGAFAQGLAELGWTIGDNIRIEYRWGAGNADADLNATYAAKA